MDVIKVFFVLDLEGGASTISMGSLVLQSIMFAHSTSHHPCEVFPYIIEIICF